MQPEIIVALDFSSAEKIPGVLRLLPSELDFFKVGLELFTADGSEALNMLNENRKKIFLDLKLHDIPNTVSRAVKAAAALSVSLLTVHALGGRDMLKAAADAAKEAGAQRPKLVAVTTLTSLNQQDLTEIGISRPLSDQALRLGELAVEAGIDGLVTSVHEAEDLRRRFGTELILVTPGIRPASGDTADQKRTATPTMAVKAGADYLVIGRPILGAPNPRDAALAILHEIRKALG